MRVHRITLRDYRGVEFCELSFADRGITLIAGDNEVGKSSAAEALHLLIEHRDDTTRASVKAVKALHLDRGAEVEAELSVGDHRFVYAKRWHRDRYTRLKVLTPEPEVLTGREAHDRVRALLAGSVDLELWRALSSPQAAALDQAALRDHPSLVAALDAAAGGDLGAADDGQLLARAEAASERWMTPTGRPKAALADLRDAAAAARAEVTACRDAIDRLEADVTWAADLQRAADDLVARHATAVAAAEAADATLAEVERRHAEVQALAGAVELAETKVTVAAQALAVRRRLVDEVAAAATGRTDAHAALAAVEAAAGDATEALEHAAEALQVADAELRAAVDATVLAEADHERIRAGTAQREIEARLAAAARDEAALAAAEAAVAANPSSPAALAAVQQAHDDVLRAEAALTAGQASVHLEALSDLTATVDGTAAHLTAGAVVARGVAGTLVVEVAGSLRFTVEAGAGVVELRRRLDAAAAALAERCAVLGVADLASARALEDERRRLAGEVAARRTALDATLAGTDVATLRARAARAGTVLASAEAALAAAAPSARPATPATAAGAGDDLAGARQAWDDAATAQRAAERAADRVVARAEAARTAAQAAARAVAGATRQVALADERAAACAGALAEARADAGDDALEAALPEATTRARAAAEAWRGAVAAAGDVDLEGPAQAARLAATERTGIERSLAVVREDLAGVRSRLELQGEGGHHDRLAEAERAAAEVGEELASVEARAAAARLLVTTLRHHRDAAARAYGAPLRAQIEALGSHVFGDGFGVVLDDDLRIEARVLDGVPVPWADLSVGAREQLAVLTRLAAATLVSPDGGVPVVFDDVLGFSDPARLALVAAAFEAAAASCQIIVFTCDADRYRHLTRAVTHHLTGPRAIGARQAG